MRSRSELPGNKTAAESEGSLRCCCGSLLARLVPDGVELKCRRCKRRVIVPIEGKGASPKST
jgi:phage FluMu protein Com